MEQKMKRIVLCLYAIAGLKIISMLYSFFMRYQVMSNASQYDLAFSNSSFFGVDLALDVFLLVLLFNNIQGLKKNKASAWAYAVAICAITAPSFALPASVYGLILLFDEEIRAPFMKKLEDKIKL